MEWIKSVLAWLLQHGDFVAYVLSFICCLGVFHFLGQIVPEITFKQKLIIFALIIGYGFWQSVGDSFKQKHKEQKEAQNASILTLKMTAPEGENRVEIETELCVSKNVPEWGNGLLIKSRDLILYYLERKENND